MNRTLLLVAGALLVSSVAFFYVYAETYIREETGGPRIPVVTAAVDIPFGEALQPGWLTVKELPLAYVEDRHLPATEMRGLVGVPLAQTVRAGEAITRSDVSSLSHQRRTLSGEVPAGRRAISVLARPESSFAGLLRPGDRVDVLMTVANPRQPSTGRTVVVAQNLLVLSVGFTLRSEFDDERGRARNEWASQVSLEVGLEDAQRLTLARAEGQIRLLMRNPNDATAVSDPDELRHAHLFDADRRQRWARRFALVADAEPEP